MARRVMLTLKENPYDPFDDYLKWLNWDLLQPVNASTMIASFNSASLEFGDELFHSETEKAIDEILEIDSERFAKVVRDD